MNKLKLGVLLLACAGLLTACTSYENADMRTTYYKQSYKQSKQTPSSKTYKLAFFENRATDDIDDAYYSLGYYKDGKLVQKNLSTHDDKFVEVINQGLDKPFVTIKNGTYYIHRPPYTEYNQPLIKGKVTAKDDD